MELESRALAGDNADAIRELTEKLKTFVRRRAKQLQLLPVHERDAGFANIHATAMYLAIDHGKPEGEASAWGLKMVLLTHSMVQILEDQASPTWLASRLKVVMERDRAEVERAIRRAKESLGEP
jgi:predicted Zn-ribbon and HTH transcriptional regulator